MDSKTKPKFYELLSPKDQVDYDNLQDLFNSKECRNRRNHRVQSFGEMLTAIRHFCIQPNDPKHDELRSLVCGLGWLPGALAVNIRQLSVLLKKCKSSINGSFQRAGYRVVQALNPQLTELLPTIKTNFAELREWTVRELSSMTPQPSAPPFFVEQPTMSVSPAPAIPDLQGYLMHPSISTPSFQPEQANLDPTEMSSSSSSVSGSEQKQDDYFNDPFALPPLFLMDEPVPNMNPTYDEPDWDFI